MTYEENSSATIEAIGKARENITNPDRGRSRLMRCVALRTDNRYVYDNLYGQASIRNAVESCGNGRFVMQYSSDRTMTTRFMIRDQFHNKKKMFDSYPTSDTAVYMVLVGDLLVQ